MARSMYLRSKLKECLERTTKDKHIEIRYTNLRHVKSKNVIAFGKSNVSPYLLEYGCTLQDRPEFIYAQLLYELIHYTECNNKH